MKGFTDEIAEITSVVPIIDPVGVDFPENEGNNREGVDLRHKTELWIANNPENYKAIRAAVAERKAEAIANGYGKFGIKWIIEALRWQGRIVHDPKERYKLSNDMTAYIARRLVMDDPDLINFISFRRTRY